MFKVSSIGNFRAVEEKMISKHGEAKILEAYKTNGVHSKDALTVGTPCFSITRCNERFSVLEMLDPQGAEQALIESKVERSVAGMNPDRAGHLVEKYSALHAAGTHIGNFGKALLARFGSKTEAGPEVFNMAVSAAAGGSGSGTFKKRLDAMPAPSAANLNPRLNRQTNHSSTPACVPPAASNPTTPAEILATGKMPTGFENWSHAKKLGLVNEMIPLASGQVKADLQYIAGQMTGSASITDADLKKLAVECFGASAADTRAGIEKQFWQAHLKLPGSTDMSAVYRPAALSGFERTVRAGRQDRIDKFFKSKK
jgi:hypothetical protein